MDFLNDIPDPRSASNGTRHDFVEILVMSVCAMLCGEETFEDIAYWSAAKKDWLQRFLTLKRGAPSADTFARVFRILDPKAFETAFRQWVGHIATALGTQMAIDGKALRGSAQADKPPVHLVTAFSTDKGLALAQEKVADKSNEITAIPALLDALFLKGFLVSIDAMGCQKEIARQITDKQGDYLLAVKGNQPTLHQSLEHAFIDRQGKLPTHEQTDASHGRLVVQIAQVAPAKGIVDLDLWANCKTVGRIDSVRIVAGKQSELEQRYYISSRNLTAQKMAEAVRSHWAIENELHWILDVQFGDDASTVRKDNGPQNLSLLKKIVLNLVRSDTTDQVKRSVAKKRKMAAWEDDFRMRMLGLECL